MINKRNFATSPVDQTALGLHSLSFHLHLLDKLLHDTTKYLHFYDNYCNYIRCPNFYIFYGTDYSLDTVEKQKLRWFDHVSRSSGLAKTILQGNSKKKEKKR